MKKIIALLLSVAMLLTMAACGNGGTVQDNPQSGNENESQATGEQQKKPIFSSKITVEDVKNAKVTDAAAFDYLEVKGGVSITGYSGEQPIVVIPEEIGGMPVVSIGDSAFVNDHSIKGLKIADTVEIIENSAFLNCVELVVVVSGASVKVFDEYSFGGCEKLETVILNDGVEVLDDCFAITNITEIEIPSSVVEMDFPFVPFDEDDHVTIIGEAGSYVEQYVNEFGEEFQWTFQAK